MKNRTASTVAKRIARVFVIVLVLSIVLSATISSASAYEVKGRTLASVLGMDGAVYYNWLRSHLHDTYYNTTPYAHADHRNPNGDCDGAYGNLDTPGEPALNCMGFVWHALYIPTKMSGGNTGLIPSYGNGGWYGLYTGYNLSRRYFNSKRDLLASGYAEPGDIIWMFEVNEHVADDSNHIAIYLGNGHTDRVWHAVKAGTKFGYINPDYEEYMVIKTGAIRTLSAPKLRSVVNTAGGPRLTWHKVNGAKYYRVYVKNGKKWKLLGQTNRNYFTDKKAKSGKSYTYSVRCVDSNGSALSPITKKGMKITYFAAPGGLRAEYTGKTGVKLTWKKVAGAPKYRVLRSADGKKWAGVGTVSGTAAVDKKAQPGKKYFYAVRVLNKKGRLVSAYKTPVKARIVAAAPVIRSAVTSNSGLTLKWSGQKGAEKYVVYQKKAGTPWKRVGVTKKTSLLIKKPVRNANVMYTVRCMNDAGTAFTSPKDTSGFTAISFNAPKITHMEALQNGIKLTIGADKKAARFNIFRKNGKIWAKVGTTDTDTFVDATATPGKSYTYTVRSVTADRKSFTSGFNATGWTMAYAATPQLKATVYADGVKLTWQKSKGMTGFKVFIKQDGKWKTLANTKSTSYNFDKAVHNTEYAFTVRCIDSRNWYNSFFDTTGVSVTYIDPNAEPETAPSTEGSTLAQTGVDPEPLSESATEETPTQPETAAPTAEQPTVEPTGEPIESTNPTE